ncbi:hypothetical protein HYG81_11475 [Natrinema zhouii]|uniref:Uncharacterized protein n=1 Tax=Natrinema zhouii TaxID=1710539 RepID=A0A7D6CMA7_9EURY|nr:hypothetical protein [Natrinema zhouii]QLK24738.1 hypothetical protein HYG81_11475 [Natrinema zhouii]
MPTHSNQTRAAVRCESCDAILVGEITPAGSIRPLGTSEDCVCGDGSFTRLKQPASSP